MNQVKQMFGVTRVPQPGCDKNVHHPNFRHVTVLVKDQLFSVPVYNVSGQRATIEAIRRQLIECVKLAQLRTQPSVSLLTSLHRDKWATAHQLLTKSLVNRASLDEIETSLFAVSLDDSKVHPSWSAHAGLRHLIQKMYSMGIEVITAGLTSVSLLLLIIWVGLAVMENIHPLMLLFQL